MGGFAGVVGHAAAGFEGARQADVQRQFADEQNRRAMAGEFLHGLITDPNQSPELRELATNIYVQHLLPSKAGIGKPLDFGKMFSPLLEMGAQLRARQAAAQNAPPPPPFQTQVPGMQAGAAPQISAGSPIPLPPSVAGPSQQGPPQMTGGTLNLPVMNAQVQGPPPPPQHMQGLYAGIPEIAQNTATLSAAPMLGQAGARQQILSQIPGMSEEPALTQGALALGMSPAFLSRTTGAQGGGFAGQLRAMGQDVPMNIPDNQWVNYQPRAGGTQYVPGKAPGEVAGENGTMLTQAQAAGQRTTATQQARFPFDVKKIGIHFANSLALQENSARLAIQSGNLKQADQIYMKGWQDLRQREGALQLMQQNLQEALNGNQQAMVSLLFNHIGMTAGAVPGTRMARATVEEAMHSTPWLSGIVAKWFHQDETGDYIFDGLKGGINLTKPQMEQMVDLAKNRVGVQQQVLRNMSQIPGMFGTGEETPPGVSAIGGFSLGGGSSNAKPRGGGPPKQNTAPPQQPSGHQSFAEWKKAQKGMVQ